MKNTSILLCIIMSYVGVAHANNPYIHATNQHILAISEDASVSIAPDAVTISDSCVTATISRPHPYSIMANPIPDSSNLMQTHLGYTDFLYMKYYQYRVLETGTATDGQVFLTAEEALNSPPFTGRDPLNWYLTPVGFGVLLEDENGVAHYTPYNISYTYQTWNESLQIIETAAGHVLGEGEVAAIEAYDFMIEDYNNTVVMSGGDPTDPDYVSAETQAWDIDFINKLKSSVNIEWDYLETGITTSSVCSSNGSLKLNQLSIAGSDSLNDSASCSAGSCDAKKSQLTKNPIRISTGNKEYTEHDFKIGRTIDISRNYNSQSDYVGNMGHGWTWSYGWSLSQTADEIEIRRPDGKLLVFSLATMHRKYENTHETISGNGTSWTYNVNNSIFSFGSNGSLEYIENKDGMVQFAYDAQNNLTTIADGYGIAVNVTTANGNISSLTDSTGRVWAYSFDANNNLSSVTYPDGLSRTYLYTDADIHNLTGIVNRAGVQSNSVIYDAEDRATESTFSNEVHNVVYSATDGNRTVTDSLGNASTYTTTFLALSGINVVNSVTGSSSGYGGDTIQFNFDADDNLTNTVDGLGVVTSYSKDANGNTTSITEAVGTSITRTQSFGYDGNNNRTSQSNYLGGVTATQYDSMNLPISITNPLGHTVNMTRDFDGTVSSYHDGYGATNFSYTNGLVASVTHKDGTVEQVFRDSIGRPFKTINANGGITLVSYDVMDNIVSITYPDGSVKTNVHDVFGNIVSTAHAGLTTTFTYDDANYPLTKTAPDGSQVIVVYDAFHNIVNKKLVSGGLTVTEDSMTYDNNNNLLVVTHLDGTSTTRSYDANDKVISVTDEAGHNVSYTRDALKRITRSINSNNETVDFAYSAWDEPVSTFDSNGVETIVTYNIAGFKTAESSTDIGSITYTLDNAGLLLSKNDGDVTNYAYDTMNHMSNISYPNDPSKNVSLTYSPTGQLASMNDFSGVTNYTRDAMDRETLTSWLPMGMNAPFDVQYVYSANGTVNEMIYPSGKSVSFNKDNLDRIASITTTVNGNAMNLASNVQYNGYGAASSFVMGNNITNSIAFDSRGRITSLQGLLSKNITWNANNIASITDIMNPTLSETFSYDLSDRLINATGSYGSIAYNYDANSNRTAKNGYSLLYTGNQLNTAVTRDGKGNRISDTNFDYAYSVSNRMVSATDKATGAMTEYAHNGRGERAMKLNNGIVTYFMRDLTGRLIGEYKEVSSDEFVYASWGRLATIHTEYVEVPVSSFEEVYWHHNDHLGTPKLLSNASGVTIWSMTQTPFGIATVNSDVDEDGVSVSNNFRFTGQYFDVETGLNYNYFRTYDPKLGRYTQADPIGLAGGMNRFGYVGANPVSFVDPTGENPLAFGVGLAAAISVGSANAYFGNRENKIRDFFIGASGTIVGVGIAAAVPASVAWSVFAIVLEPSALLLFSGTDILKDTITEFVNNNNTGEELQCVE